MNPLPDPPGPAQAPVPRATRGRAGRAARASRDGPADARVLVCLWRVPRDDARGVRGVMATDPPHRPYGLAPGPGMRGYRAVTMSAASTLTAVMSQDRRGISMDALAHELGVSRRTLYRWRGATFHDLTVGGWTATFVVRPSHLDGQPVQVTPWRPA